MSSRALDDETQVLSSVLSVGETLQILVLNGQFCRKKESRLQKGVT